MHGFLYQADAERADTAFAFSISANKKRPDWDELTVRQDSVCHQRSLGTVLSPEKISSSISAGMERMTFILSPPPFYLLVIIAINVENVQTFL